MSRLFGIIIALCCILAYATSEGYNGYKIYEVIPEKQEQSDLLNELSKHEEFYDFFNLSRLPKQKSRVMVNPNAEENFVNFLNQHKIEWKVINENVGKTIETEFAANRLLRKLKPASGQGRLSNDRYYTYSEILAYIDDIAKRYPQRVYLKTVGNSYEKNPLKTLTITNGDGRENKKVIWVDGGFHAREWISHASVLYLIDQLVENFNENADLLKDYDWIILPVVNPDGYVHTHSSTSARLWRKTRKPYKYLGQECKGADPNRNFDFHWNEEGASSIACMETYAGPSAFSEQETIVVRDLLHSLVGRGVMYLTIHSYGNYLLYPWGWTAQLPDTWQDLDDVARAGGDAIYEATGTQYSVGSSTNVLYIAAGASDDYAFHIGFPISITMELPGGGKNGFDPPASSIDEYVKETWIGIRAMAKKVQEKYP